MKQNNIFFHLAIEAVREELDELYRLTKNPPKIMWIFIKSLFRILRQIAAVIWCMFLASFDGVCYIYGCAKLDLLKQIFEEEKRRYETK